MCVGHNKSIVSNDESGSTTYPSYQKTVNIAHYVHYGGCCDLNCVSHECTVQRMSFAVTDRSPIVQHTTHSQYNRCG